MEMVLPASYAVIEEEEMMYLEGGKRYYNLTGLFGLLVGAGGGAAKVYSGVKTLWTVSSAAVKTALKGALSSVFGYLTLVYYASSIAMACTYLNRYGSYQVKGLGIGSWNPISYVTR